VLDQLSLLKMSPGGRAASLGILLQVRPDLGVLRPRARLAPFTLRRSALGRMGPPGMLVASAFVPGYRPGSTAIFAPKASFRAKSACLNPALAWLLAKSPS
jgi:hypothetical protein